MIKTRYRLEETSHSLKIQPMYHLFLSDFKWYIGILVVAGLCLPIATRHWGQNGLMISISIMALMLFYIIRDYCFRINVRYIFDKTDRTVYKTNLPFVHNKRLMSFDEMAIFTNSEPGGWTYSIGIKKKQFLKSYRISEHFGSGKKSARRQAEYEDEILSRIEVITDYNRQ